MFKKGCPINHRSLLSGADRKKLRRALEQRFAAGLGEDGLELLLPSKTGEMEVAKVSGARTWMGMAVRGGRVGAAWG